MFRGIVPGMRYSCSEGQAGGVSLLQPQGPSHFAFPAAAHTPAASAGLLLLFSHALLLHLRADHLLCLLLPAPSSRKSAPESLPSLWLCFPSTYLLCPTSHRCK